MKVKLPILFHTDETSQSVKLGLGDPDLGECEERIGTFYDISCIMPYKTDSGSLFTEVISGYQNYICPLEPSAVDKLIETAKLNQK